MSSADRFWGKGLNYGLNRLQGEDVLLGISFILSCGVIGACVVRQRTFLKTVVWLL